MNQIRLHLGYLPSTLDMGKTLPQEGWIHPGSEFLSKKPMEISLAYREDAEKAACLG